MVDPIIKVENLSVIYNKGKSNEVRSLTNVNLDVFPKEYIIVHGPSGCGKSTLLYSVAGLQMPTEGEVTIEGKKLSTMNKKEKVFLHRERVGMIFQSFYLISSLNVLDNICLPRVFRGEDMKTRRKIGMKLLRRFGIENQAYKFPSQLSGGQKQRVAIVRSLINNPDIILADEPTGNLDSESSYNAMVLIKELNEVDQKTIILVTHNPEHLHYGDRIVSMRDGKIISEEVNREKRPPEAIKKDEVKEEDLPPELRILMRAFKNLTPEQIGALLVPYKSKQLLYHILFGYTEEQINAADGFLKELLFNNITIDGMQTDLDRGINQGGAGWDKRKSESFSQRVREILWQASFVRKEPKRAPDILADYIANLFDLELDAILKRRLASFLDMRTKNLIDCIDLKQKFDKPRISGGLGLYSGTAEKIVREVELIMLLGYSP
jgi:putative ABC transport system ATP-binding protein